MKKSKCVMCKKKVLMTYNCSMCENSFCLTHRHMEIHQCSLQNLDDLKKKQDTKLVKCIPSKIEKI